MARFVRSVLLRSLESKGVWPSYSRCQVLSSSLRLCHSETDPPRVRPTERQTPSRILPPSQFEGAKSFSTSPAAQFAEEEESDDSCKELVQKLNTQLSLQEAGRLFAVVHVGAVQRKVTTEDILLLQKEISADVGDRITLNKVLLVGSRDFTLLGRPVLSPNIVRVEATVIEKTLSHTIIRSYYRRRKKFRRFKLKRVPYSILRINSIELNPVQSHDQES